ncbi:unnamed protein product [Spodoptera littoralis]|uniref:Uncharacterized protein n=1 Tax=Spodoptera littoralis TaxID=7109 RepID=A0A9P0HX72_SPOLI|nr:unnamed protein product [Spodoptera littoralis]CAH1636176.1 unnamed protein product [Spodoptera littoralis]
MSRSKERRLFWTLPYSKSILQRATYNAGLLTIQGVSTCLYLCMDACGFQYAHNFTP